MGIVEVECLSDLFEKRSCRAISRLAARLELR